MAAGPASAPEPGTTVRHVMIAAADASPPSTCRSSPLSIRYEPSCLGTRGRRSPGDSGSYRHHATIDGISELRLDWLQSRGPSALIALMN